MSRAKLVYEATGTTDDGATIVLETPVPVRGRVKVQLYIDAAAPIDFTADRESILRQIHERQKARGHKPMTAEEIEAYIRELRHEDDDEANLP